MIPWIIVFISAAVYLIGWSTVPQLVLNYCSYEKVVACEQAGAFVKATPVLMLALIAAFIKQRGNRREVAAGQLIGLGLALSAVGDVALDLDDLQLVSDRYFLIGLSFFLLAHLSYAVSFLQYEATHSASVAAAVACLPIFSLLLLWNGISATLKIPVAVYSCVIAGMTYTAIVARVPAKSRLLLLSGAVLFVVSDSLLAGDRFGPPVLRLPQAKLFVMLTYYSAQTLLAAGSVVTTKDDARIS